VAFLHIQGRMGDVGISFFILIELCIYQLNDLFLIQDASCLLLQKSKTQWYSVNVVLNSQWTLHSFAAKDKHTPAR
jgi:hypothetical protein